MNVYRVLGRYKLWDNETLPREPFNEIFVAEDILSAIEMTTDWKREAHVDSVTLLYENVHTKETLEAK